MSTPKEEVQELLSRLPDDCSFEDIQYHLYVIAKVRNGLDSVEKEGPFPKFGSAKGLIAISDDFDEPLATLKKFWICVNCNEKVEEQFEVCWNCQHDRSGSLPSTFSDLEINDRAEKAALSEKWRDKHCANCNKVLTFLGGKRVLEEPGSLVELLVEPPVYSVLYKYHCSACGRVEYFE